MNSKLEKILLSAIILMTLTLTLMRFVNLGYSEFQGDEVAAQNFLFDHQTFWQFLMSRTIGPMQYIIAYIFNSLFSFNYQNIEFWIRLPFAIASLCAVFLAYKIGEKFFDRKVGVLFSFILASSGLIFAFSRFVQYQSFVILLSLATLYFFLNAFQKKQLKHLIVSGTCAAIALLFHYDALTFIFPLVIFVFFYFKKDYIIAFLTPLILIPVSFYIPYILNPKFRSTLNYLVFERVSSNYEFDSIFYSAKILEMYHSKEFLIFLGLISISVIISIIFKSKILHKILIFLLTSLVLLRMISFEINIYAKYISIIILFFIIFDYSIKIIRSKNNINESFVNIWFLFSFLFYGLLFSKPLTHIYVFLVPLFLIFSIFIIKLLSKTKNYIKFIAYSFFLFIGVSCISFNYFAFIENSIEYPWIGKNYLFGYMKSTKEYGFKFDGIFGFPYQRGWKEISTKLEQCQFKTYSSNEKYRLTKYYVRNLKWDETNPEAIVEVKNPQSLAAYQGRKNNIVFENEDYIIYENQAICNLK